MSDASRGFDFTIPANTPVASPVSLNMPLGLSEVRSIRVVVPPGPNGLVGFQILASFSPAYPVDANDWYVLNDYVLVIDVSSKINSGQWSMQAYNTDVYDHILRVYFDYDYVVYSPSPALSPIVSV